MSLGQLTGKQMDAYESLWTRVVLGAGATLLAALFGGYFFRSGGTEVIVCGIVAAMSLVLGVIASVKLHELDRAVNGSRRKDVSELPEIGDVID